MGKMRNQNYQGQSIQSQLKILTGAVGILLAGIFFIKIYPGPDNYAWEKHVRVEEYKKNVPLSNRLQQLKDSLLLQKVAPESELYQQVEEAIRTQNSILDYRKKLSLSNDPQDPRLKDLRSEIHQLENKARRLSLQIQ
ncbi:MAG: hypothetical protein AAF696_10375 [Bacteroidota bacterium]